MPGVPCANHPQETTFVRCGRCDKPICVRCMVDTPVGKKCRECARNRTHVSESTAGQVAAAFLIATAVAIPAGLVLAEIPILILPSVIYGYVVGEAALRGGRRSRSLAVQVVTGIAALIGAVLGFGVFGGASAATFVFPLVAVVIGVMTAVSRVRYL